MSKLNQLAELGQSIWYDYIRRSFINSGELQNLIEKGLRGITSNPSIFENAIAGSADYNSQLSQLIDKDLKIEAIYEALALEDVARAADLMAPVYENSAGKDGYVSIEVNPTLAHNTSGTIEEAKRLFSSLNRPNIMIKVPATEAGIPAIRKLISLGIHVNVTLIFGIENYRLVAEAYINGLSQLAKNGPQVKGGLTFDRVSSVASFFVSRVDTAVDNALDEIDEADLKGKTAISNAKLSYLEFQQRFGDQRWHTLAQSGAKVQRLLWASTGVKNPVYPDTMYVDQLIGADTVNTIPPTTLTAFLDHGTVSETLSVNAEEAKNHLKRLSEKGIDLIQITKKLQEDGVNAFTKAFETLLNSINEKREKLRVAQSSYHAELGDFQESVDKTLQELKDKRVISRIWEHDHTVWKPDPTEITNRLGWLHSTEMMEEMVTDIDSLVKNIRSDGYTDALLLGMGGSSLAPEVFRKTFGVKNGYLDLSVLDSTDPGAVLAYTQKLDPAKTLYLVSTKSGGTVETLSFMKYFYNHTLQKVGDREVGKHYIAITDPGSSLESLARELNFRKIFLNDYNVGGRYSALTYFGLVPAGLMGVDLYRLLERSARTVCNAESCNCPVGGDNTAAWLGATLGELALAGRDKVTFIASPPITSFGAWLEQLIAESTGKEKKGILPVDGEEVLTPNDYARDRLFVYLRLKDDTTFDAQVKNLVDSGFPVIQIDLNDLYDLGGEFFRWEMATAIASWRLQINPFDQPNVESAKVLARNMVKQYQEAGKLPDIQYTFQENGINISSDIKGNSLSDLFQGFFSEIDTNKNEVGNRSYVALQAYLKPDSKTDKLFYELRIVIQKKFRVATTYGYGPRFLHSTGQLHKGDAGNGLFIQFTATSTEDVPIPDVAGKSESSISFGILKDAQSLGDRQALIEAGRKVMRIQLADDVEKNLNKLIELLK